MEHPPMSPQLFVRWNKGGWPVLSFGPEAFAKTGMGGAIKPRPPAQARKRSL